MTPSERAALLADVAAAIRESMQQDARPQPRQRRPMRCTVCGRERQGCSVRQCKYCGGWMVYDATKIA